MKWLVSTVNASAIAIRRKFLNHPVRVGLDCRSAQNSHRAWTSGLGEMLRAQNGKSDRGSDCRLRKKNLKTLI